MDSAARTVVRSAGRRRGLETGKREEYFRRHWPGCAFMQSGPEDPDQLPVATAKSAEESLRPDRIRPPEAAPADHAGQLAANVAGPSTARAAEWFDRMVAISRAGFELRALASASQSLSALISAC